MHVGDHDDDDDDDDDDHDHHYEGDDEDTAGGENIDMLYGTALVADRETFQVELNSKDNCR